VSKTLPRNCEHCLYFRQEELGTGYCQFHEMFVLRDFDCGKFVQRPLLVEGGEASPDSAVPEKENV
jgi:hypothetical protein